MKQTGYIEQINFLSLEMLRKERDFLDSPFLNQWLEQQNESVRLEVAKMIKLREIERIKRSELEKGVEYLGEVFQAEERDINLILSVIVLHKERDTRELITWISKYNNLISFSLDELIELSNLMIERTSGIYLKARSLKDSIIEALRIEEVEELGWIEN